jgi:hypothetical protein
MIVTFLGRNTPGILADARREFGEDLKVLVVSRDGDQLQPPAGVETVSVSEFEPTVGESYTLIANGGTSSQLLPVVKRLVKVGVSFQAWDLQREGKVQVW